MLRVSEIVISKLCFPLYFVGVILSFWEFRIPDYKFNLFVSVELLFVLEIRQLETLSYF